MGGSSSLSVGIKSEVFLCVCVCLRERDCGAVLGCVGLVAAFLPVGL